MEAPSPAALRHTVPAVNKALELVRLIAEEGAGVRDPAGRLGISRTSSYRILRSLQAWDWLRAGSEGGYELSLGLLALLEPLRGFERLAEVVEPALASLARRSGLTAKLSVRQADHAVTIARRTSSSATHVAVSIGASFHLSLGSSGAVFLSALSAGEIERVLDHAPEECWHHQGRADVMRRVREYRARGFAADLGGYRPTCHAVSAGLCDHGGGLVGAVTLVGFPNEVTRGNCRKLGLLLAGELASVGRKLAAAPRAAKRCGRSGQREREGK